MKITAQALSKLAEVISQSIGAEYVFAIVLASPQHVLVTGDTDDPLDILQLGTDSALRVTPTVVPVPFLN